MDFLERNSIKNKIKMLPAVKTLQTSTSSMLVKVFNSSLIEDAANFIKDIRNSKIFESFNNDISQPCSNLTPYIYVTLIVVTLFIVSPLLLYIFYPRFITRIQLIFSSKIDELIASKN